MVEKRGRQSSSELSVVALIDERRRKIEPPPNLPREVEQVFREIVESCAPHFVDSDKHLLVAYATAIVLTRWAAKEIATDPGNFATWEKAVKIVATLSTRLRLAPQARTDSRKAGRNAADESMLPKPWERAYCDEVGAGESLD